MEPIELIRTDRRHLDSYSLELSIVQNTLYAGYGDERFSHFRKTFGYANMPLDGIWLRAPYLHNGSVPTLRDLLEPSEKRPKVFYRGFDLYDADAHRLRLGAHAFDRDGRSLRDPKDPRQYFRFAVECRDAPEQCDRYSIKCGECVPGSPSCQQSVASVCGNGNRGHEGREYGTELSDEEKRALVEFLKTF